MSSPPLHSEKELLARIAIGDQSAFAHLFEWYRNRVYTIAMRFVQVPALAEEIVQDVFLKIWLKRADLQEIDHFEGYLHTMVRNQAFKGLKSLARYQEVIQRGADYSTLFEQNIEELLQQKDYQAILQKAVTTLPFKRKMVYQLTKEEGLTRQQVAERLQLSPETVKVHLGLAMRSIRAYCMARIEFCLILLSLLSEKK